jgi:hypothetical protein
MYQLLCSQKEGFLFDNSDMQVSSVFDAVFGFVVLPV